MERLKREGAQTRGIASEGLRSAIRMPLNSNAFDPATLSSCTDDDTVSESHRQPNFDPIFSEVDRGQEFPDLPVVHTTTSPPPIHFQREINSLQKEIESLKLELVTQ
jgi:hypothetical protein